MVHNSVSTHGKVANVAERTRSESAQRVYPGSGLREGLIHYVLLFVCIHGGITHVGEYNGDGE